MRTIKDFNEKYGTGKKYDDFFTMMCRAKKEHNPLIAYDVECFIADLRKVCNSDFDALLWRDYQFITNWE